MVGETSGDILGAGLMDAVAARTKSARFRGIAGPRMQALGARSWHDMDDISVMGFDGLFKELPNILSIRRNVANSLLQSRPDVFVGIDVPDFNLGLERRLKNAGIPAVHYVSPTVWAWRGYRIKRIRHSVTRMLALFPFEAQFYAQHDVPVSFVGHPMADEISGDEDGHELRTELSLNAQHPVVAMLPGSRLSEVNRLAPAFLEAAERLSAQRPGIQFVVPFASARVRKAFETLRANHSGSVNIALVDGRAREAMAAADVVLLASGTAALEAALLRKPMVVTYRVSAASAMLIRRFVHVEHFSMPNHLLNTPRIPELIQEAATAERMAEEIGRWLDTPDAMTSLREEFAAIHDELRCDASARAAEAVLEVVSESRARN